MYGNMYEDEEKMLEEAIFPRILSDIAEDFSWVRSGCCIPLYQFSFGKVSSYCWFVEITAIRSCIIEKLMHHY